MSERIIITGSRDWCDKDKVRNVLSGLPKNTLIIHGGCRGLDTIGGNIAKELGLNVYVFNAEWKKYGNGAGPIRNQQMIDVGMPTRVIAFHENIEQSRGTLDMINRARRANLDTKIYD